MAEPWDRQEKESSAAYGAFRVYLEMGTERSLVKAGQIQGKSRATMEGFSKRWKWQERARAWDSELLRTEMEERKRLARDKASLDYRQIEESVAIMMKGAMAHLSRATNEFLKRQSSNEERQISEARWAAMTEGELFTHARLALPALAESASIAGTIYRRRLEDVDDEVGQSQGQSLEALIKALKDAPESVQGAMSELLDELRKRHRGEGAER